MALLRYVSHAEVEIDPAMAVPRWGLSNVGRGRVEAMLAQPWLGAAERLIVSGETKAVETASILASKTGLDVEIRSETGEVDRSSTGFVSSERHEELADALFARPTESADGWERAIDAQARVAAALADVIADGPGDVIVVGHGGVGTLLYCSLAGLAIDRGHDQQGQGHYWTFDRTLARAVHPWQRIDDLI